MYFVCVISELIVPIQGAALTMPIFMRGAAREGREEGEKRLCNIKCHHTSRETNNHSNNVPCVSYGFGKAVSRVRSTTIGQSCNAMHVRKTGGGDLNRKGKSEGKSYSNPATDQSITSTNKPTKKKNRNALAHLAFLPLASFGEPGVGHRARHTTWGTRCVDFHFEIASLHRARPAASIACFTPLRR